MGEFEDYHSKEHDSNFSLSARMVQSLQGHIGLGHFAPAISFTKDPFHI